MLDPVVAQGWLERWDAQQERYVADREERFRVVIDVVHEVVGDQAEPRIVDLGCGPGSLAFRLAERLPGAQIVAVDADPVLLAMGRARRPASVRLVEADLADSGWTERVGLEKPWDAVVSSTALHWLPEPGLAEVYGRVARQLRAGGVLVNADHMYAEEPLETLASAVRQRRAERVGVVANEDWSSWWDEFRADPQVAPLVAARTTAVTAVHGGSNGLSAEQHAGLLRAAGFAAAGPVWQFGDDHVLVAVR